MPPIVFRVSLFDSSKPADIKRSRRALLWLLEALVQVDMLWLAAHPNTTLLYKQENVHDEPEYQKEDWQDVPHVIASGKADCEDLTAWRVGELRLMGINARPYIRWRKVANQMRYHALVWLPGNEFEDPSISMGMHGTKHGKPVYID